MLDFACQPYTCDFLCSPSDVNECEDNLHHCTELCINLPGSYICSCPDGFILEEDGTSCSSIMIVINPRRACAARVTGLSVCVCVSVC